MAKIALISGKICSGKTTYAKKLIKEYNAVLLSCDELMLSLFGQYCGDKHDEIQEKVMSYLFNKSLELASIGTNVIIDFGFWSKAKRKEATDFYRQNGITPEWHYIDISDEVWKRNVEKRNKAVENAEANDYYLDENVLEKVLPMFEIPEPDEIDIWYKNEWTMTDS